MPLLYKPGPLTPFPGSIISSSAGYTQRMLYVAANTSSRTLQTYQSGVRFLIVNDTWLHTLSDAGLREADRNTEPYQSFHVYTTSLSSPDGDLAFKKGDQFIPNGSLVGLVSNTAHTIAGVQQFPQYWELILWRKI